MNRYERVYQDGKRQVLIGMALHFLRELDEQSTVVVKLRWIAERLEVVTALRRICERYGDNEWDENLHLVDVVEKHLENHLDWVSTIRDSEPIAGLWRRRALRWKSAAKCFWRSDRIRREILDDLESLLAGRGQALYEKGYGDGMKRAEELCNNRAEWWFKSDMEGSSKCLRNGEARGCAETIRKNKDLVGE